MDNKGRQGREYCIRVGGFVDLNRGCTCGSFVPTGPKVYRNCYNCINRGTVDPSTGKPTQDSINRSQACLGYSDRVATDIRRWF